MVTLNFARPETKLFRICVEIDGCMVANGSVSLVPYGAIAHSANVALNLHPDVQNQCIGSLLFARTKEHLRAISAVQALGQLVEAHTTWRSRRRHRRPRRTLHRHAVRRLVQDALQVVRQDLSLIAFVDGKPAATAALDADFDNHKAISAGTDALREYRGITKLIKSLSLRAAADRGSTAAYTGK